MIISSDDICRLKNELISKKQSEIKSGLPTMNRLDKLQRKRK